MAPLEGQKCPHLREKRYDSHYILARAKEDAYTWLPVNSSEARSLFVESTSRENASIWERPSHDEVECNIGSSWLDASHGSFVMLLDQFCYIVAYPNLVLHLKEKRN